MKFLFISNVIETFYTLQCTIYIFFLNKKEKKGEKNLLKKK